ncbi:probable proteasome inhibitor [Amborella trichopoda]|uniref:PI31 proteasome regulator N-terminal domain-containing protein n=1 Tax=Amborella trichopoda TaxID=13333 RepID=U5DGH7_AMBTC|nr:probable proteasome inhibitor [Amborella trichopoda]ERN20577.1 hypothetical protein AMTR_s00070p00056610 [Amborella trichopoda]|eukprot:XP_006859110.1 probable proteasome inhibitor [Amborella trichopoda]
MASEGAALAVIRASRPTFRNPKDKVAFAVHASFIAAGYSLIATGNRVFADDPSSFNGQEEVGIEGWNDLEDCYGYVYSKPEKGSNKLVLVKCLAMGDKLVVDALRIGDESKEPLNLEVNVNDYVRDDATSSNYAELYKDFSRLVDKINSSILLKIEPPVKKDTTSTTSRLEIGEGSEGEQTHPSVSIPLQHQPYSGLRVPPVFPVGISDLLPGPGAGMYPRGDFGIGGDMLLGPNDPHWGSLGGGQPVFPGGIPGVPPGARFEPYGPPGVPGFEPGCFVRNPRRPPGNGHPDLEHFSPF